MVIFHSFLMFFVCLPEGSIRLTSEILGSSQGAEIRPILYILSDTKMGGDSWKTFRFVIPPVLHSKRWGLSHLFHPSSDKGWPQSESVCRWRRPPSPVGRCVWSDAKKFAPPPLPWCHLGVSNGFHSQVTPNSWMVYFMENPTKIPYAPWCWNIYQHLPHKSPSYVGKYTSTMEHMGMDQACLDFGPVRLWFSCKSWWVGWKNLGIESTVHTRPGKHTKSYGKSTHF